MNRTEAILELRRALKRQGLTIRGWGRKHGYCENTVTAVLHRHVGRETFPHGKLSLEILSKLKEETGVNIQ